MSEYIDFKPKFESDEKIKGEFERLLKIHAILKEMGFKIWEYASTFENFKEEWDKRTAFPLVWEGGNGIRVSPDRWKGLVVWFTNSFEDPENPVRLKVKERLTVEGLWNREGN